MLMSLLVSRCVVPMLVVLALAACDTPQEAAEREISRTADPAARAAIVADPAVRAGVVRTSVFGSFGPMPARSVYSEPVSDIVIAYDPAITTKAQIVRNVGRFCAQNGFGAITRQTDLVTTYVPSPGVKIDQPTVQIKCAGFNAPPAFSFSI
jgi:hypothetical protein